MANPVRESVPVVLTPVAKKLLEQEVVRVRATGVPASRKGVLSGLIISALGRPQGEVITA